MSCPVPASIAMTCACWQSLHAHTHIEQWACKSHVARHSALETHGPTFRDRAIIRLTNRAAAVLAPYDSFKWMGCVICAVALFGVAPIYFPMWGGLLCGPKKGVTEEDYYFAEYTPAEREAGHHLASSKFVSHFLSLCFNYF